MAKYSASNYDVQKTSGVCASTGDELAPGDTCWSALVDIPVEERVGAGLPPRPLV